MKWAWIGIFFAVLIWSGIDPKDFTTWCLEVAPAVIGGIVLWATRERFPLTPLVYALILVHCVVLMVGGHYTYAEVPAGEWLRELVDGTRNNYDKLGHFVQGFIPVMIARELMIRLQVFNSVPWRNFYIVCLCLAISALYELTESYVWDTQSDMGWALFGAIAGLLLLGRLHDRQLARFTDPV